MPSRTPEVRLPEECAYCDRDAVRWRARRAVPEDHLANWPDDRRPLRLLQGRVFEGHCGTAHVGPGEADYECGQRWSRFLTREEALVLRVMES